MTFIVSIGKGRKNSYKQHIEFDNEQQAILNFNCYNVHSGGKVRLMAINDDGRVKVLARHITD